MTSAQVNVALRDDITCTLTNAREVTSLTLVKIVSNTFGGTGTETDWELRATGNNIAFAGVTGTPSVTEVSVAPGTYVLSETGDLKGYDGVWRCLTATEELVVTAEGAVSIPDGEEVTCTITNSDTAVTAAWTKVDTAQKLLDGSVWRVTGPGLPEAGIVITDCAAIGCGENEIRDVNPQAGAFEIEGLRWGQYQLVEESAPAGHQRDSEPHIFTIGGASPAQMTWNLGAIVNETAQGPALPLSGGIGRDAFLYGGIGIAVLGLMAGALIRRTGGGGRITSH